MLSIVHTFSFLCIILSPFATAVIIFVTLSNIQFIGLTCLKVYTALFCVMSFCELENKHESLRTVHLFISNCKIEEKLPTNSV